MTEWLAIDQSTSSTKAVLFDGEARVLAQASAEHTQHYPQPGWIEHDAEEIFANVLAVIGEVVQNRPQPRCLSIANQRETVVVFDRTTGRPLHRAIVWQDRRGEPTCERLRQAGHAKAIEARTGLRVDTYFPAPKLTWLFEQRPDLKDRIEAGQALIGTIDTYLIYRLTGGAVFATDPTNASRTLLYDIHGLGFDPELCRLFGVPPQGLAEIRESGDAFGTTDAQGLLAAPVPIQGVMGDSQAALFAQRCFSVGQAKVSLGTGSSVLVNIGPEPKASTGGLVTALGWVRAGRPTYTFEGIINCTGATIHWLKDELGLIESPAQTEPLAASVPDAGGVYLVPAFAGLSAPYWAPDARGAIVGLSRGSTRAHVVRAALESIAYQLRDVLDLVAADAGQPLLAINADGGMVANRLLMQIIADVTGVPLRASRVAQLSAMGAAMTGMLGQRAVGSLDELARLAVPGDLYHPAGDRDRVERAYAGWRDAVRRVL